MFHPSALKIPLSRLSTRNSMTYIVPARLSTLSPSFDCTTAFFLFGAASFNIAPRSQCGGIIRESRIPGYLGTLQLFQRDFRDSISESGLSLRACACPYIRVSIIRILLWDHTTARYRFVR